MAFQQTVNSATEAQQQNHVERLENATNAVAYLVQQVNRLENDLREAMPRNITSIGAPAPSPPKQSYSLVTALDNLPDEIMKDCEVAQNILLGIRGLLRL